MNKARNQESAGIQGILAGGGEMGALMRQLDWSSTPVGPVSNWPHSLRVALRILLGSGYPMYIGWGPEFTQFYNDAYRPILGRTKHPAALGRGTPETFREIWDFIGPMFQRVLLKGEATTLVDQALFLDRNNYVEECYYTFSYSPIPLDEPGKVGGVFVTVIETTERLIDERRLRTLRDLAARSGEAKNESEVCRKTAETLGENLHDLPFSLLYLCGSRRSKAVLAGSSGIEGSNFVPQKMILLGEEGIWPLATAFETGKLQLVTDFGELQDSLPRGPWPITPNRAAVVPIQLPNQGHPAGFLIAGLNPRKEFDDRYQVFLERIASQTASSIADARAFEEERRRAEVLAELDRAKTTFFSNVSHELRTPLTLLLGPLEEALRQSGEELSVRRGDLEIMNRNALRLLKLVNTLLDFSRIEAGRIDANYEPVDLARLTGELASVFRSAIERAGLRLIANCDPLAEPVYVDPEMWEKIVLNLVSNAFKFTLQGEIEVSLSAQGRTAELRVRDTGSGIPEQEIPLIFGRFHRVKGSQGRSNEGTGIGLALVNELVKLHGGTVAVESRIGHGSTFTIRVPFGSEHLPAERVGARRSLFSTRIGSNPFIEEALLWFADEPSIAEPGKAEPATAGEQKPRVLIADDNADMRDYLRRLLEPSYEVSFARDGIQAFEIAVRDIPDLLLSDIMMPRMDGFELLSALRADHRTATMPIILVSARAGEEAKVEGLQAGADDYLIKPFTSRELLARVAVHIDLARMRREAEQRIRELEQEKNRAQERAHRVLESMAEGFLALDYDWRVTYLNRQAERVLGFDRKDLLERNIWEIFPELKESSFGRAYQQAMTEKITVRIREFYDPLGKWFGVTAFPAADGLSIFFQDITKQVENEKTLLMAEKLAAAGRLAATISHEINNPLEAINNLVFLAKNAERREDAEVHLSAAEEQLARVAHITRRALGFYRSDSRPVPEKMSNILDDLLELYRHRFVGRNIQVIREYQEVEAIPIVTGEIRQVFANLISNALDAIGTEGVLKLKVASRSFDEGHAVDVIVEDNGPGIAPENLERLFTPFFTTKKDVGTGLGLWIVQEILKKRGGSIAVESSIHPSTHGTKFLLTLPAAAHDQAKSSASAGVANS